jgi:hypothetical protein
MPKIGTIVPAVSITFAAFLVLLIHLFYPVSTDIASPLARLALSFNAASNIVPSLVHWLLQPDAGLESIAKIDLGPPSPARTVAIALHRKEGQERLWMCITLLYISCYQPQLTFAMLILQALHAICSLLYNILMKPMHFKGKFLAENAPGQFTPFINILCFGIPILCYFCSKTLQVE